jgi:hypothetical protein
MALLKDIVCTKMAVPNALQRADAHFGAEFEDSNCDF